MAKETSINEAPLRRFEKGTHYDVLGVESSPIWAPESPTSIRRSPLGESLGGTRQLHSVRQRRLSAAPTCRGLPVPVPPLTEWQNQLGASSEGVASSLRHSGHAGSDLGVIANYHPLLIVTLSARQRTRRRRAERHLSFPSIRRGLLQLWNQGSPSGAVSQAAPSRRAGQVIKVDFQFTYGALAPPPHLPSDL